MAAIGFQKIDARFIDGIAHQHFFDINRHFCFLILWNGTNMNRIVNLLQLS